MRKKRKGLKVEEYISKKKKEMRFSSVPKNLRENFYDELEKRLKEKEAK